MIFQIIDVGQCLHLKIFIYLMLYIIDKDRKVYTQK